MCFNPQLFERQSNIWMTKTFPRKRWTKYSLSSSSSSSLSSSSLSSRCDVSVPVEAHKWSNHRGMCWRSDLTESLPPDVPNLNKFEMNLNRFSGHFKFKSLKTFIKKNILSNSKTLIGRQLIIFSMNQFFPVGLLTLWHEQYLDG